MRLKKSIIIKTFPNKLNIKPILFGNLTIDHNITESGKYVGPGGSVYFTAKTFENLGYNPVVVSPYGKDFPRKLLPKTILIPAGPNLVQTLVFRNTVGNTGRRKQSTANWKTLPPVSRKGLPEIYSTDKGLVIVAPVLPNMTDKVIKFITENYTGSLKVLLPQGFYRKVTKEGKIKSVNWEKAEKTVPLFDIVILSDKDFANTHKTACKWSKFGIIVIVTREDKGCSLYKRGAVKHFPAYKIERVKDSTGAGDVFAPAFAVAYLKTYDLVKSAAFANATAGLSLRFLPNQLKYNYRDILNFATAQNRPVEL